MLTEVLRRAMLVVENRFQLAVLAAERASQLLHGTRPAVDNPDRERVMKVALREIADGKITRTDTGWKVDRPPSALEQVFNLAQPVEGGGDLLAPPEKLSEAEE